MSNRGGHGHTSRPFGTNPREGENNRGEGENSGTSSSSSGLDAMRDPLQRRGLQRLDRPVLNGPRAMRTAEARLTRPHIQPETQETRSEGDNLNRPSPEQEAHQRFPEAESVFDIQATFDTRTTLAAKPARGRLHGPRNRPDIQRAQPEMSTTTDQPKELPRPRVSDNRDQSNSSRAEERTNAVAGSSGSGGLGDARYLAENYQISPDDLQAQQEAYLSFQTKGDRAPRYSEQYPDGVVQGSLRDLQRSDILDAEKLGELHAQKLDLDYKLQRLEKEQQSIQQELQSLDVIKNELGDEDTQLKRDAVSLEQKQTRWYKFESDLSKIIEREGHNLRVIPGFAAVVNSRPPNMSDRDYNRYSEELGERLNDMKQCEKERALLTVQWISEKDAEAGSRGGYTSRSNQGLRGLLDQEAVDLQEEVQSLNARREDVHRANQEHFMQEEAVLSREKETRSAMERITEEMQQLNRALEI